MQRERALLHGEQRPRVHREHYASELRGAVMRRSEPWV